MPVHRHRTYEVPEMTAVLSLGSATSCDLEAMNGVQVCSTCIATLLFKSRNKVQQLHHIYSTVCQTLISLHVTPSSPLTFSC